MGQSDRVDRRCSKPAYTEQAGYPAVNNTGTTLPVTTAAVGDVMLVMAHTAPSSGTSDVTSITDSNSRITWQAAKSAGFTNHPSGDAIEIWYGVVKSIGATTIDVHWSGTTFDHFVWADEWKSVLGDERLVVGRVVRGEELRRRDRHDLRLPDAHLRSGRRPLLGLGVRVGGRECRGHSRASRTT